MTVPLYWMTLILGWASGRTDTGRKGASAATPPRIWAFLWRLADTSSANSGSPGW